MNDHLSIDGQQRYEAIYKKYAPNREVIPPTHRTPPPDTAITSRYTRKKLWLATLEGDLQPAWRVRLRWWVALAAIVIGAVALAWMCVPR